MLEITQLTYTAIIGFLIVVILGPIFIPMLAKFKFGQTVRDDGPQTHLQKNGTPTMGGVIMIIAILITGLTRAKIDKDLLVGLICITGFGFVGFLDDFIKIKMKRSLGLKAYQKIILQFALALFVSYYQYSASPSATQIMIPFTDYIIKVLNAKEEPIVFILWGNFAKSKKSLITNSKHLIIESSHPSPFSAYNGFFGSKPFSKTNNFLIKNNIKPIDWSK